MSFTIVSASAVLWLLLERSRTEVAAIIAKLRDAEQAARASDRAKTEFLANVSHEIRTPLHVVLGITDLLGDMDLPEEARRRLEVIQLSGESLLVLINDVLDFSKMESGRVVLVEAPFDLRELLEAVERMLRVRAEAKGLQWSVETGPGVPRQMIGDAGRLRQILLNLGGNAVKFTSEGSVRLRVEADGDRLRFLCIDTGIGISEKDRSKIFETFVQADSSAARRVPGTGLGLAISSNLVELMGGRLEVESERGVGSTFRFEISAAEVSETEQRARIDSGAIDSLARRSARGEFRVLLVDDHAPNRLVSLSWVEDLGYLSLEASGGLEAVEMFQAAQASDEPIHAILLDCQMPEVDGFETARRLRAWEDEHDADALPIIALTADVSEKIRERCSAAGMSDFLAKPFRRRELAAILDRALLSQEINASFRADRPDPEALRNLRRQGERLGCDLVVQTIEAYLEGGPKLGGELSEAVAAEEAERLSEVARRLEGSSAMLGAERLARLCREVQTLSRNASDGGSKWDDLTRLVMTTEEMLEGFIVHLEEALRKERSQE